MAISSRTSCSPSGASKDGGDSSPRSFWRRWPCGPTIRARAIGTFLIERAIATCKQSGRADFIVLVGHPAYYPRFGFVQAGAFGVTASFAHRPEAVMLMKIGFLAPEPGEIRLPGPFEGID